MCQLRPAHPLTRIQSALLEGTKSKVPKIAAASVAVIEQAIKTFGVKVVGVKDILKEFGNWFEHTNADVRAQASSCTVELRRWLGTILDKPVSQLRDAQQKELGKLFEEMPKTPAAPTKYRRFEMEAMMAAAAASAATGGSSAAPKEIDAYELAEAVNVLGKCTPQFYTDITSKKWKERKEALEAVVGAADSPRIESGDYGELIRGLKKLFADANVFVVELAIRLIGLLGRGLRKEFGLLGKSCVGGMLEKFKEKKQVVVSAIHEALEFMHPHCFTLLDIAEDLEAVADSKVPSVKAETLTFVIKCLKVSNKAAISKNVKPFTSMFMKLMGDGDPSVREKSFEAFGVLIGLVGERTLQGYIAKLEPIQDKRVREFIPASPIGITSAPPPIPVPQAAPLDAAELASLTGDAPKKIPVKGAAAPAASKKTPTESKKGPAGKPAVAAAKSSPKKGKDDEEAPATTSGFPLDKEGRADITARLGAALLTRLDDADWKKRHEALIQVEQTLVDAGRKIQMKGVFELVNALKKRLADSNKNLVIVSLNLFGDLATACGPSINEMMKLAVHPVFTCFTDGKPNVREAVAACLDKWVAEVAIDSFFPYLHNAIALPSGKKEILKWIATYLPGASKKADFKILIKDVLNCLEDKTKEVRVQAEPLIAEIARRVGLKPIEAEISKLKPASAGPIRQLLSSIAVAPSASLSAPAGSQPGSRRGSVGSKNRFGAPVSAPGTPQKQPDEPEPEPAPVPAVPEQGPVRRNAGKASRELANLSWSFDEPPADSISVLKQQAQECFSAELLSKMFDSTEAKDHAAALSELEDALEPFKEGVLDSLDVIFKWASLRLFDSNLAVLRKTVGLFSQLLGLLEIWQVHLSDFEARSFMLIFVERMGIVSHETVLSAMRGLLKQFNKMFPASKTFKLVMQEALLPQTKLNAQSRSECLKYLGALIHQQSLNVCSPTEALPIVAYWLGDRDADVAEAALDTLAIAQRFVDSTDAFWALIPSLPVNHRALVEKKLENPSARVIPVPLAQPLPVPVLTDAKPVVEKTPILVGSAQKRLLESLPKNLFKLELDSLTVVTPEFELAVSSQTSVPSHLQVSAALNTSRSDSGPLDSVLAKAPKRVAASWIRELSSGDAAKAIDCMKVMASQFKEGSTDDLNFLPQIDSIVLALANRLLSAFPLSGDTNDTFRQLKYMLNTLMLILGKKSHSKTLSLVTLKKLLQALLLPMLEDVLSQKEEGKQLLKVFNVAVLKALDNCERTHAFVSLLQLMRELIPPLAAGVDLKQPYPKMAELVLKCLLKLVKVLTSSVADVSLEAVLRELHLFFTAHPPLSWRRRTDELPLEAARTLLDRFVKSRGFDVCKFLSLIPAPTTIPSPAIFLMVHKMLRAQFPEAVSDQATLARHLTPETAQAYAEILGVPLHSQTPELDVGPLLPALSFAPPSSLDPQIFLPTPASTSQVNSALDTIRKRLMQVDSSAQALVDLACLLRDHGSLIDFGSFLGAFSPSFAFFVEASVSKLLRASSDGPSPSSLVSAYSARVEAAQSRCYLGESTDVFYPTQSVRAFAQSTIMLPTTSVPQVALPQVSLPAAEVKSGSEKSSISALRERLKQAAASDSAAAPKEPAPAVGGSQTLPALIDEPSEAAMGAASASSSSLAALRERLARIKGAL